MIGIVKLVEMSRARGWEISMSRMVVLTEAPIDGNIKAATAVSTIACQSLILRMTFAMNLGYRKGRRMDFERDLICTDGHRCD